MSSVKYQPHETTLVLATPEQRELISQVCYDYWIKETGASFRHYERAIEQGAHATEGRLQYFVLVPRSNTQTEHFLSFIRTMQRDCLYRTSNTSCDAIESGISYVLEAVYTPPEHRRHGYARHALRLLHYILAIPTHLPPYPQDTFGPAPPVSTFSDCKSKGDVSFNDALFSTLWSDVGREYYARATIGDGEEERDGWVVYNDRSTVVTLADSFEVSDGSSCTDGDNDGWQIRAYPSSIPLSQRTNRDRVRLQKHDALGKALLVDTLTTPGALEYYLDRMSVSWPAKYLPDVQNTSVPLTQKVPSVLYLEPSSSSLDAPAGWAIFAPHFDEHPSLLHPPSPPTLDITDLHIPPCSPETFSKIAKNLLCRLAEQARQYECEKMEIWDADEAVLDVWREIKGVSVEQVEREMRLGAIAWYGPKEEVGQINVISKQM